MMPVQDRLTLILFIILLWVAAMGFLLVCMANMELAVWNVDGPGLTTGGLSIGWGM